MTGSGPAASPPGPSLTPAPEAVASSPDGPAPRGGTRRRATWSLLDQVLSSLANFGLTIAVARAVDEQLGGVFTYAFMVFTLVIGLTRAVSTDPLVIRFSAADAAARGRAAAQAAGASTAMGLAAGALCLAVGLVLRGDLGAALALLLLVLPGHLLQDSYRSAAFAGGDPRRAALNDVVRVVVQFAGIGLCVAAGTTGLSGYLASWAAGAWAGALVGAGQFGRPALLRGSRAWLRDHAGLSARLGSDYLINMGAFTLATSVLAALLGFAATGGLRFAQTVLGPIQVLFGATTAFLVPMLARRLAAGGPARLRRPSALASLGCFGISAVVVGVLLLIPTSLGRELLGASWDEARAVMVAVGWSQCVNAIAIGGSLPLKAMGRADLLLWVTAVQAPLILGLGVGGGVWLGIQGAAWGMAVAQTAGCVTVMTLAWRAMSRRPAERRA
ncbi:hypothetical protein ACI79Y_18810 [Modestobacter sp. SYSU DS0875]